MTEVGYANRLVPSSRSSLQPVITRTPHCLPAACARTMPAIVFRSVMARCLYPNEAPASISSCGCEAPRKNEKLVVTCSSVYFTVFIFMQRIHADTTVVFSVRYNALSETTSSGSLLHLLLSSQHRSIASLAPCISMSSAFLRQATRILSPIAPLLISSASTLHLPSHSLSMSLSQLAHHLFTLSLQPVTPAIRMTSA